MNHSVSQSVKPGSNDESLDSDGDTEDGRNGWM